ncbi:MAG: Ig-like domain-containing protein [Chloroflexota bacterium]
MPKTNHHSYKKSRSEHSLVRVVHEESGIRECLTPHLLSKTTILILAILLFSLWVASPATPIHAQTTQVAPTLVETNLPSGASWQDEVVLFTFDEALDSDIVDNLTVYPDLAGATLIEGNQLIFTPSEQAEPGTRYRLTIDDTPIQLSLVGHVPLQITSTQPDNNQDEVNTAGHIVIVFNRPVVSLVSLDSQGSLPHPVRVSSPDGVSISGLGEWLNTSIYRFTPTDLLAGDTTYTVSVDAFETDAQGGLSSIHFEESFEFQFTTSSPSVITIRPRGPKQRPDSVVKITFSQPMDRASVEDAYQLLHVDNDALIDGDFGWNEASTQMVFTPTEKLFFGHEYIASVDDTAVSAAGRGSLRDDADSRFAVVPLPQIESVNPSPLSTVPPDRRVSIKFNTAMSSTSALANISISPPVTGTNVYSEYSSYNATAYFHWPKQPNTVYTITVGGTIADPYGNTLGAVGGASDYQFSFTTGNYPAFTRIDLGRFTHFNAYTTTNIGIFYRNVESVEANLYRVPEEEFFKLAGDNQWQVWDNYRIPDPDENLVWSRSYASIVAENITGRQRIKLTDPSGADLPPGLYLLEVERPPLSSTDNPEPHQVLVVLSNYNLVVKKSSDGNSLAWLTDLRTGRPLANRDVSFYSERNFLASSRTDDNGIALVDLNLASDEAWQTVMAIAGTPGDLRFAAATSEWHDGIAPWDFNLNTGYGSNQFQTYFYTDRPIYRPGQTIYWKGIMRVLENDVYRLPPAIMPVDVTVRDDQGQIVHEDTYVMNRHGTVHGEFTLSDVAVTGYYFIEARIQLRPDEDVFAGAGFQVASYRKPEFEISVSTDEPEIVQGDTIQYSTQVNYFSGGAMADAPVKWRLIAQPHSFFWADRPEKFKRHFTFQPYDPERDRYDPYYGGGFGGLLKEGEGITDSEGNFVLEMPTDLSTVVGSQQWVFDVTVQSPTNQFVSGRTSVTVHKNDYAIGLSPRRYIARVNQSSEIDVVTLDALTQEPYANADLEVVVYEFKWNSLYERGADNVYRWQTSVERKPVFTSTILTFGEGTGVIKWTPTKGGQYQVVARSLDRDDTQMVSSAAYVWVSSRSPGSFVAWPRENHDRIELVADKERYAPGETAQILIPSPFVSDPLSPVTAMVTVERGGIMDAYLITLESNSDTLGIPITADHIPNIYVSVVIVKGVDETNPVAAMRLGYIKLPVETNQKELTIDIASSSEKLTPGESVEYELTVTDFAGRPVPNAEVSVALIDKAVLSLASGDTRDLLDIFYYERALGVTTGALLNINKDRMSQQLADTTKGGGGGGGGAFGLEVREEFPDVAFWRADFTSDADGVIRFDVDLPDNLTTWRLVVRGVTDDTRVGDATHDVVVTKPLQVRPLIPRFFTAGDFATIGAAVINTTDEPLNAGMIAMTLEGAQLSGSRSLDVVNLPANSLNRYDFDITVDEDSEEVVVLLEAFGVSPDEESLTDAVRMVLPVHRYQTPEVVATSGQVDGTTRVERVRLPDNATGDGSLLVTLEPSLAEGMIEGLNYLKHYPYECNEQTVSRFLPNLFTVHALKSLAQQNPRLEADLEEQLNIGVQRLIKRQNFDGGWGYWPSRPSRQFITAYVLWGLWHAQEMGIAVPERTIDAAVENLYLQFQSLDNVEHRWERNQLAFLHFVLAEVGEGDPGRASTLYDERESLSIYGQAYLAMALHEMREDTADDAGEDDPRVTTLLSNIASRVEATATTAFWQEASLDFWTLDTNPRTTSIVLAAFSRIDPDNALLPNVVRWLMQTRKAGRWATTQENAWALISLTDWMVASGELEADYAWDVSLNETALGAGSFNDESLKEKVTLQADLIDLFRNESNALILNRSNDSGQLYYTTHLRYYLDALNVEARDQGIVVDRRFDVDKKGTPRTVTAAKVGDVISVTMTLVAPTTLYHTLVEVPLPAGLEPIDTKLATSEFELSEQRNPFWWRTWRPTHIDIRDEKVALFATQLRPGTYEYTFRARASIPGTYRVLPIHAEQMYYPEVWGRSAGSLFTVYE